MLIKTVVGKAQMLIIRQMTQIYGKLLLLQQPWSLLLCKQKIGLMTRIKRALYM